MMPLISVSPIQPKPTQRSASGNATARPQGQSAASMGFFVKRLSSATMLSFGKK
jgi:hypothetical protein